MIGRRSRGLLQQPVPRILRRLRRAWWTMHLKRYPPAGVVLLYHRVLPERIPDPFELVVRVRRFADHLAYLTARYEVVPLERMVDDLLAGRQPRRRQVAVTFDDGYADNFLHAYPLLQRAGVSATIFLPTDYVDSGQDFWWDRLRRPLVSSDVTAVSVPSLGRSYTLTDRFARADAVIDLTLAMIPLAPTIRESLLRTLETTAAPSPGDRPLAWSEVREMLAGGLVSFGAHTGSHPRLAALTWPEAEAEVVRSRERIYAELGVSPTVLAYPYGGPDDVSAETKKIVRRSGFRAAFMAEPGIVAAATDPFAVPRVTVGDWSVPRLDEELLGVWTGGAYLRA